MNRVDLFATFHLNLAYSSIEATRRSEVIRRCYRPLLDLVGDLRLPCGIEATALTLEWIRDLAPDWIADLRSFVQGGLVEFVGSGYSQIIGPLVPADVNAANLRLGNELYAEILGIRPRIALVNEQCFSAGLVPLYREAGYEAIVMEWDNPAAAHPSWPAENRYRPQLAADMNGGSIPLLWSQSIPFQKVQRYAHGELELDEILAYLDSHRGRKPRCLCLYGGDTEVFDFRPGRYATEAPLAPGSEWDRLAQLFEALENDDRFDLVAPGDVLARFFPADAQPLGLASAAAPVPTKKQYKYNVTRWAVTGRDDLGANTLCWSTYLDPTSRPRSDDEWRRLCRWWASDLRTHITDDRWEAFRHELETARLPAPPPPPALPPGASPVTGDRAELRVAGAVARFDLRRGLAVRELAFGPGRPVVGTVPHGRFAHIDLGADFYTGHVVFEGPGQPKITDLAPCREAVGWSGEAEAGLAATVDTPLGPVHKRYRLVADPAGLELEIELEWDEIPAGRLRVGYVTLLPEAFESTALAYRTHNGGPAPEPFTLSEPVEHGEAVSFLVSARQALGMTGGWCDLGDRHHGVRVHVDRSVSAPVGMVSFRPAPDGYLLRLALSARELDETTRSGAPPLVGPPWRFRLRIEPTGPISTSRS